MIEAADSTSFCRHLRAIIQAKSHVISTHGNTELRVILESLF